MRRLRLLDAFCHKGGASMGYHLAGFDVVGIDIDDMNDAYPFEFVQGDAVRFIEEHGAEFDAIAASPPCQAYTPLNAYNHKTYPDLIAPTREALLVTGRPYVIENVEAAAPELKDPIMLCGPMFGLRMYRHRLFETNWPLTAPAHRAHVELCSRNGYLPTEERPFMSIHGGKHSKAWQRAAAEEMGMPWLAVKDGGDTKAAVRAVCEAIPPAYTEYIGTYLMARVGFASKGGAA
jgi:DNA (cytosine-5)-methyltransferase 1